MQIVHATVPEARDVDFNAALNRLRKDGFVRLTKPIAGDQQHDAYEYSGSEDAKQDEWFFFEDRFNVVMTEDGHSYLDYLRALSHGSA